MPTPRGSDEVIGKHQTRASALVRHIILMLTSYHFLSNSLVCVPAFYLSLKSYSVGIKITFLKDWKDIFPVQLDNHL